MSEDQAEDWTNLISDWIAMADRMQADEGAESEGGDDGDD
jgi:hypothetical protein